MTATSTYLHAAFGSTEGVAHIAVGTGGHWTDTGRYEFAPGGWTQHTFQWPGEADALERAILQAAAAGDDTYCCPYVLRGQKRDRGTAVARRMIHADIDHGHLDLDLVRGLGGFAVASGTPGNGHVYVTLDRPVTATEHTQLCRALGAHLGGADAKISDNDVLRPPGTVNGKHGTDVTWAVEPTGAVWAPEALAETLGVTLSAADAPAGAAVPAGVAEPVNVTGLSQRVRDALANVSDDRSADTMRVVGACHDAGLTLSQTRYVVADRGDLAARLAERTDDDVLVCWLKATDDRVQRSAEHRRDAELVAELVGGAQAPQEAVDTFQDTFVMDVEREAARLRVRDAAREKIDREKAGDLELPPLTRLDDFLATPDEDVTHRIAGLWPKGGRVVLAAQNKAGKTTLTGNVMRSLVDGADFLDEHPVEQVRRIVLIDNELDQNMLRSWLRSQGIGATTAVELVALRGRLSTFNIIDPATRARWAKHIGPGDVLVFDCLRPALDALGLSEDKDAGRFLEALDELSVEAGIPEGLVVHHMGHSNERSRGDSRILDWPDAIWKLVRDAEDTDDEGTPSRRYFSAYGRDVDQSEQLLRFDPLTRRLSIGGGSRAEAKVDQVLEAVLDFVAENQGASKNAIEGAVEGRREVVRKALAQAVEAGVLEQRKEGRAHRFYPHSPNSPDLAPANGRTTVHDLAHSPIGRGRGERVNQGEAEGSGEWARGEITCAGPACANPPRPERQMCTHHFTLEPSRKDD